MDADPSELFPARVQERMVYEVLASYGLASVAALIVTAAVFQASLVPALGGWLVASVAIISMVLVVSFELIAASNEMTASAKRLADSDFSAAFDNGRRDELGDLAVALSDVRDNLQTRIDEAERAQAEAEDATEAAEAAREEAEAAREETRALLASLEAQADEYAGTLSMAADGDLTVRLDEDTESEPMARTAEAANEMLADLDATLGDVRRFGTAVDETATDLSGDATDAEDANERTVEAVEAIDDAVAAQQRQLGEVESAVQSLSATVQEVAAQSDEVAADTSRAATLGRDGRESAAAAIDTMETIQTEMSTSREAVTRLVGEMDRIREMVELIEDVAEQTNMLALNANIEAARADESGDGFAVVADEVKDLAGETGDAVGDISATIDEVETEAEAVADAIEAADERVEAGVDAVEETVDAVEAAVGAVTDAEQGVQSIASAADDQAQTAEQVAAATSDVRAESEETTEVAAGAVSAGDRQHEVVVAVTDRVETLADRTTTLDDQLSSFSLSAAETANPEGRPR